MRKHAAEIRKIASTQYLSFQVELRGHPGKETLEFASYTEHLGHAHGKTAEESVTAFLAKADGNNERELILKKAADLKEMAAKLETQAATL